MENQQSTPMESNPTEDVNHDLKQTIPTNETQQVENPEIEEKPTKVACAKIELEARKYLMDQAKPVTIPSYTSWFKFAEIHQIE
ncbi:hypothetical protein CU098_008533, partial [Rhizopus stolonifer]